MKIKEKIDELKIQETEYRNEMERIESFVCEMAKEYRTNDDGLLTIRFCNLCQDAPLVQVFLNQTAIFYLTLDVATDIANHILEKSEDINADYDFDGEEITKVE